MSATPSNSLPVWVQDRDQVIAQSTDTQWRYQTPPDYSRSKENLARESTCNFADETLEAIVQNLVRTFEMEVSFKSNPQQWLSVVNEQFRMSSNGGSTYTASDVGAAGTYNLFIGDTEHYKASGEDFESSAKLFHTAFPNGFPWEVLEVYSSPPNVAFKWRHWGHFKGQYKDFAPTGETVEVVGMSLARVTDDLKIISLEHYFDNTRFLDKLTSGGKGTTTPSQVTKSDKQANSPEKGGFLAFLKRLWHREEQQIISPQQASGCPFRALMR